MSDIISADASIEKITDKSEYQIDGIGEVRAKVLVGGKDETVGEKVVPNINTSWECFSGQEMFWMNLNRKNVTVSSEKETFINDELSLKIGDNTDIWKIVDGKLKWNIQFDKKPISNRLEWKLQCAKGLRFCYQDTLENEYLTINESAKEQFGWDTLTNFLADHNRPDKVISSYAVFCDLIWHAKNKDKSTIYNAFSGKLGHIYRPLVIDANGKETWAALDITGDTLSVTIPQLFLDNAVYPVVLDPDLGYNASGGTEVAWFDDYVYTNRALAGSSGTITKILVYSASTSSNKIALGLYDDSGTAPNNKLATEVRNDAAGTWSESWFEIAYSQAITADTLYWLGRNCDVNAAVWYDTDSSYDDPYDSLAYASAWNNPFEADGDLANRRNFLYAEYTVAGIEGQPAIRRLGGVNHSVGYNLQGFRRW